MPTAPRDRFDDIPASPQRVGAHRAENPRVKGWVVFLWALAATVVLVVAGIFASLVSDGTIALFPEEIPTVSATPVVEPVVDTTYSVLVLNGTPQEGLATQVKDSLLAQGWTETNVIASNASDREYPTTTVYYAAAEAEAAALGLAELVGAGAVEYDPDYPLPGTSTTQLTVVIGTDSLAAETPAATP